MASGWFVIEEEWRALGLEDAVLVVEVALRLRPRNLTVLLRLLETCVFGHITPPVAGEEIICVC